MKSYKFSEISIVVFYISIAGLGFFLLHLISLSEVEKHYSILNFAWPLGLYLIGHLFRALRLALLINASHLRRLFAMHFYTAACSAIIPFKLGELVRLNEISYWCTNFWRGLLVIWIERAFDITALALLLSGLILNDAQSFADVRSLVWLIAAFMVITLGVFFILPEELFRLNLHVIRTYKGRKALRILRIVDGFYELLQQARPLLDGKLTALSVLTLLIWGFELTAIMMIVDVVSWNLAAFQLVKQFSDTISNFTSTFSITEKIDYFNFLKQMLLGVFGIIALTFYLKWRIAGAKSGKIVYEKKVNEQDIETQPIVTTNKEPIKPMDD